MSPTTPQPSLPPLNGAPLVIGIAGPTKLLEDRASLEERIALVLDDLYGAQGTKQSAVARWLHARVAEHIDVRVPDGKVFRHRMGLAKTPLMILSSLAPGADSVAIGAIRQWAAKRGVPIEVVAPLPFPPAAYRKISSSFAGETEAAEFAELLKEARSFTVRRSSERAGEDETVLNDDALEAKLLQECAGDAPDAKLARKNRYRLAAGFVANFCDVLLALATPEEEKAADDAAPFIKSATREHPTVTSEAIATKRHGTGTSGLPFMPVFSWADGGPVIIIPIVREAAEGAKPKPGMPKVLFPAVLGETPQGWERGETMLRSMCRQLEAFNESCMATGLEPTSEELKSLRKDLGLFCGEIGGLSETPTPAEFLGAWERECGASRELTTLAMRRRRAATLEGPASNRARHTVSVLFQVVFWAAFFLHVYSHSEGIPGIHICLFLSLGFATASWLIFTVFDDSHHEQHSDDWRAIAEGMRVQFYWAAAGLPNSAAANYLERMRSELDWIRNVISAWSLPFSRWRLEFDALSRPAKLERLKAVWRTWVIGQQNFFRHRAEEYVAQKHRAHAFGVRCILGAIGLAFLVLVLDLCHVSEEHHFVHTALKLLVGVLLLLGAMRLAKTEKQMLSEHSLQYAAMRELMRAAGLKLKDLLQEADTYLQSGDEQNFDLVIRECQRLYLEIGKQALDENAEWLLLHRSRPVEIPTGG